MTKYAQAPLIKIAKRLGEKVSRLERCTCTLSCGSHALRSRTGVGSSNPYEDYKIIQRKPWVDVGLSWLCGLADNDGITATIWLFSDDNNVKREEVEVWRAHYRPLSSGRPMIGLGGS